MNTTEQEKIKMADLTLDIEKIEKKIELARKALEENASTLMKAVIILGNENQPAIMSGRPALYELDLANKIKDEIPDYPSHNDLNQCASEYLNLCQEKSQKESQLERIKTKLQ